MIVHSEIALAWILKTEELKYAERILIAAKNDSIIVPHIWLAEITNGLVAAKREKLISQSTCITFMNSIKYLNIVVDSTNAIGSVDRIFDIADQNKLSAYLAMYIDLALRTQRPLATKNRKLMNTCKKMQITII